MVDPTYIYFNSPRASFAPNDFHWFWRKGKGRPWRLFVDPWWSLLSHCKKGAVVMPVFRRMRLETANVWIESSSDGLIHSCSWKRQKIRILQGRKYSPKCSLFLLPHFHVQMKIQWWQCAFFYSETPLWYYTEPLEQLAWVRPLCLYGKEKKKQKFAFVKIRSLYREFVLSLSDTAMSAKCDYLTINLWGRLLERL